MFLGTPFSMHSSSLYYIQTSSVVYNGTSPNTEVSSIPKSLCKMFLLLLLINCVCYFCILNSSIVAVITIPIVTVIISIAIITFVFVIIGAVKKIRSVRMNNEGISHLAITSVYREKSIPMTALWCPHSVIMADFIMPGIQQPIIVIISIIYSPYLLRTF